MPSVLSKHWKLILVTLIVSLQLYLFLMVVPKVPDSAAVSAMFAHWKSGKDPCLSTVQAFLQEHASPLTAAPNASHMLYFLHIPRTAGRTYHSCFLKMAHKPSRRCARSYDVFRLNESLAGCGVLGSHDDFSVTDFLPNDTAVITQLRDPVDRILSAYEFAIEVAARGALSDKPRKVDPSKVSTLAVWPWSFLVPWIEEDIRSRHRQRLAGSESILAMLWRWRNEVLLHVWGVDLFDPYNNNLVMPLSEFLQHPVVDELLHNGATLQVLGATNYSHWGSAGELRRCYAASAAARQKVEEAAIQRLRSFLHVGVQEALDDSIASLAADLGLRLDGIAWRNTADGKKDAEVAVARLAVIAHTLPALEVQLASQKAAMDSPSANATAVEELATKVAALHKEQQDLQRLVGSSPPGMWDEAYGDERHKLSKSVGEAFRDCSKAAQRVNGNRRTKSLSRLFGPLPSFSKETRRKIPGHIITRIRDKNALDVALHKEGRAILKQRLAEVRAAGLLEALPPRDPATLQPSAGQARSAHTQSAELR